MIFLFKGVIFRFYVSFQLGEVSWNSRNKLDPSWPYSVLRHTQFMVYIPTFRWFFTGDIGNTINPVGIGFMVHDTHDTWASCFPHRVIRGTTPFGRQRGERRGHRTGISSASSCEFHCTASRHKDWRPKQRIFLEVKIWELLVLSVLWVWFKNCWVVSFLSKNGYIIFQTKSVWIPGREESC